jgi:hypothetical protein
MLFDSFLHGLERGAEPVLLLGKHPDDLPAACDQRVKRPGFLGREGPDGGSNPGREECEPSGIDGIGLGKLAGASREIAGLARVGDHDWNAGAGEGDGDRHFEASGSFEHDQAWALGLEVAHQGLDRAVGVLDTPNLGTSVHRNIQVVLGYVDAYEWNAPREPDQVE